YTIRVRAETGCAVGYASAVAVNAIDHGKWSARLRRHDARVLPASEKRLREALALKGELVGPSHVQDVALIIVRAGIVGVQVSGVHKVAVLIVRRIVE